MAATAIAYAAGADVAPTPYRPVLRALLLTGETPRWLRSEADASELVAGTRRGGRRTRSRPATSRRIWAARAGWLPASAAT